jgi:TolB-like protein/tetratricopeptide (TPR) repeat protein
MNERKSVWQLGLLGPPTLTNPNGENVVVSSRRGWAILAMLGLAPDGVRSRSWLQSHLWASRDRVQAQGSLRRELAQLRKVLNSDHDLLLADHRNVRLDLSLISMSAALPGQKQHAISFLEGLEVPGEPRLAQWLADARSDLAARSSDPVKPRTSHNALTKLVVCPFSNETQSDSLDYLSMGIADDLRNSLSRYKWLQVIAVLDSTDSKSQTTIREMARELNVDFVLQGRVYRRGRTVAVSAWLVDATSIAICWENTVLIGEEFDNNFLENLVLGMSAALGAQIDVLEQGHFLQRDRSDGQLTDLIWRGRWHLNQLSSGDARLALELFEAAVDRAPNSAEAALQLATAKLFGLWATRGNAVEIAEVRQLAHRAILANPDDSRAYVVAAMAEMWMQAPSRAETLFNEALSRNPADTMASSQLAGLFNLTGRHDQALSLLNQVLAVNPRDQHRFYAFGELALASFALQNWQMAIEHADQSIVLRPSYWYAHMIKVGALWHVDSGKAKAALKELIAVKRDFGLGYLEWLPFKSSQTIATLGRILAELGVGSDRR